MVSPRWGSPREPAQWKLTVTFTVYDEDMVVIDAFNTGLLSRGGGVVRQYRHVFDLFRQVATTDIEPILDRYRTWYLAQLTDDGGGQSSDVPGR